MTTRADAHTVFPILGPTRTPVVLTIDLQNQALIADIVAVNGIPAKGTYVGRTRPIISSPNPAGGGAIADVTRTSMREHVFEILRTVSCIDSGVDFGSAR